jgi:glutathione S-transferase
MVQADILGEAIKMSGLTILGIPQSNFTRVARMAALEKGIPYEFVEARPHAPEIKAIHPAGKVPVMRHGDVTMFESRAIAHYIDDHFPGPALTPRNPAGDAQVEQWISYHNSVVDPLLIRRYLFAYVFPKTADKSPDRILIDAMQPALEREVEVLDHAVARGHLVGDSFTLADIYMTVTLWTSRRFPELDAMVKKTQNLSNYIDRHAARESFKATMPPPPPKKT